MKRQLAFIMLCFAAGLIGNNALADGITIVSQDNQINGSWAYDLNPLGPSFDSASDSSADGTAVNVLLDNPAAGLVHVEGTLSSFSLNLFTYAPYVQDGRANLAGTAITLFQPLGNQLTADINGYFGYGLWLEHTVSFSLKDITNGITLVDSQIHGFSGNFSYNYIFNVSPLHLYEFSLGGSTNQNRSMFGSSAPSVARASIQLNSVPVSVPDSTATIALLGASLAGLALLRRRLVK